MDVGSNMKSDGRSVVFSSFRERQPCWMVVEIAGCRADRRLHGIKSNSIKFVFVLDCKIKEINK